MKLVDFSVRRPVTVFIFAVAAVVFGGVAFRELATDLLPDISYPSLTVRTEWDGAAPLEVESLVTRPVENAVGVVNNVVRVTSSSRADAGEVTLEFGWGTDMDLAALDVRERLDVLVLPDDAERPVLLRYDPSLDPILRLALSGPQDLVRLRLVADERVKRSLERIEGVAAAVVSGGLEEEIQVQLDETRLAGLGLSADEVLSRLAQENVNLTGGRLREGRSEYLVRTVNEFLRPEDLEPVVVASAGGALVRLEDVAQVRSGHRERELITRIDGRESIEIAVYKEGGTNTVAVSDAVRDSLDTLRQRLREVEPGLELSVISDQARYIRQSVDEVLSTAMWGGTLAILVLFLFLRSWKTTLIIGIAIPVSVITTFFLMYAFEISLNIMSLGGLTLGIGLLVDNSIVVLESIQRRRDRGLSDVDAAREGASVVGRAVIASTLTTICVFVPIVFVEGIAGQLFGDQALTVTYSLVISLLVALSVIPMLASRSFRPAGESDEEARAAAPRTAAGRLASRGALAAGVAVARLLRLAGRGVQQALRLALALPLAAFGAGYDALASAYGRALDGVLRRPLVTVLVAFALLGGSLLLVPLLGSELVPELVQGEFYVDLAMPPGTHLDVTQRRVAAVERAARELPGVESVYAVIGASAKQGGVAGERRENIAQVALSVAPPVTRDKEERLMAALRRRLEAQDDLDHRFGRPAYFSFRNPVEVEIRGFNLTLLGRLADEATRRLRAIPGLADVEASTEGGTPELQIAFDRQRLAALGLTLGQVAGVVRDKVQGAVATEIQRADRTIDIRVRSEESYRDSVADLRQLIVHQSGRTAVPLSSVAEVRETVGPAEIRRAEGDRVAVISANLAGRDLASVSEAIAAELASMSWPAGFDWRIGGQRQEMETSFGSLRLAILLAVFMVYLVMASQFESLLHPFVILFSVPFAVIGVVLTLWLCQVRVSIVVLIGAVLLAGIVVNNAIILVDQANRLRRERSVEKLEALRQAGRIRLRPILMTTATTVLGLLPMAIGLGAGSELRAPMALTVIGGLVTSTLLTLLVVPAIYSLVDRSA